MPVTSTPIRALDQLPPNVDAIGTAVPAPAPTDATGNPQITAVTPAMMVALNRLLEKKPDQKAEFEGRFGGDALSYINSTLGWFNSFSDQVGDRLNTEFAPEQELLKAAGFEIQGGQQPVEQDLLGRVLNDYVYPSLQRDKQNQVTTNAILDNTNRTLDGAITLNQPFINSGFSAAAYLNQFSPDQQNALKTQFQSLIDKGIATSVDDAARYYFDNVGKAKGDQPGITGQLGAEYNNADDVQRSLAASAQTEAAARLQALDAQKAQLTAAIDANNAARTGASGTLDATKLRDLDAATAQLRAGLSQLEGERNASLAVLNDTRLAAAQGQVTAVNQGLERTKDQLSAQQATRGFVGTSSLDDANLARAIIGARQDAANVVGGARVVNATDSRNLADAISGQRFGITSGDATQRQGIGDTGADRIYGIGNDTAGYKLNLAGQDATGRTGAAYDLASGLRGASDKGTAMRSNYFDVNSGRQLAASLVPAQIASSRLTLLNSADANSQNGLTRSLANLGWFTSGATPPPAGAFTTSPSQAGNDLAGLGAGLFSGAVSVGNANSWWQTPKAQVIPQSQYTYNGTTQGMIDAGAPAAVASRYGTG